MCWPFSIALSPYTIREWSMSVLIFVFADCVVNLHKQLGWNHFLCTPWLKFGKWKFGRLMRSCRECMPSLYQCLNFKGWVVIFNYSPKKVRGTFTYPCSHACYPRFCASMLPCFHASMLPCFHASMLLCFPAFLLPVAGFCASVLPYQTASMPMLQPLCGANPTALTPTESLIPCLSLSLSLFPRRSHTLLSLYNQV